MLYLDNAATTKPFPWALELYAKIASTYFANPSSIHYFGASAKRELDQAREEVLSSLKLSSTHRCVFLSGATEGNNTVFSGVTSTYASRGKTILFGATEHPSVKETALSLTKLGFNVKPIPVNEEGKVTIETLSSMMDKDVILVSIMAVNNEVGTINDIPALAKVVKGYPKAFFHSDITQSVGKVDMDYSSCDFLTFSGHKLGALKGSGALILKSGIKLESFHKGGAQENGYRAGTVDLAGAMTLSKCLAYEEKHAEENRYKVSLLNQHLRESLKEIEEIEINSPLDGSPYLLNFSFRLHKASVIVEALSEKEIYVSSISACSSKREPFSYVLEAMGKDRVAYENSVRVSFNPELTIDDIDMFTGSLKQILSEVKPR